MMNISASYLFKESRINLNAKFALSDTTVDQVMAHILDVIEANAQLVESSSALEQQQKQQQASPKMDTDETLTNHQNSPTTPTSSQNDSSLIISNYDLLADAHSPPKHSSPHHFAIDGVEIGSSSTDELFVTVGSGDSLAANNPSNENSGKPFFASKLTNSQMSEELSHELGL